MKAATFSSESALPVARQQFKVSLRSTNEDERERGASSASPLFLFQPIISIKVRVPHEDDELSIGRKNANSGINIMMILRLIIHELIFRFG